MDAPGSLYVLLVDLLCSTTHCERSTIGPHTDLIEIGFDSLSLVALVARIEADYGCSFTSEQVLEFLQAERVEDLQRRLEHALSAATCET